MAGVKTVGVLAVQGAFIEHSRRLEELGVRAVELRQGADVADGLDGLVLPGGESTVQSKLLRELGMFDPLRAQLEDGMPVFGTCAGLILLAQHVANGPVAGVEAAAETTSRVEVHGFATMPVSVVRNAYGRQLGSFHITDGVLHDGERRTEIPMTFIRAPHLAELGDGVDVLASLPNGTPVAARYRNQIGATFHPELDEDLSIYRLFAQML
ncbi:pyridoxal 5'-phosphate synthase glutaminase subunit PdxT [Arcanobacterium haemolyticum]|uniref:pyridoxal 5'-phosphate synthase glutaminase subunit PdxT n=1 Tax=Arcanobacterium haemolyticum TaxID=28264 RepID=UPI000D977B45|nr:pyridoxal 5'-phosphate synthase glutaminase subunit PdxT [Arcanobacterium haemolyticum]QCX46940.1 pyridoxal 5'-phosphate synthase glutaminase subunit PdxT [Arcanobacterium haemolyticum]SPT76001.1 Glutamine amidotransferase subunit pdxT [Arcanobacterium haemolyticum]